VSRDQLSLWEQPQDEIVVKANELIMGQLDWTLWEYRVFISHVAQIRKEDTSLGAQVVYLRDLKRIVESRSNNDWERGKDIANRLTDKKIQIEITKGNGQRSYAAINVYSSCVYEEEQGAFVGRFTEEMKPFLLQLKKRFTMYYKRHALALSSIYAVRFYEIIKRYEFKGEFELTVDEIRTIFNLHDKYRRFSNLKRRVIEKARKEINKTADVTFDYEVIREGQSPVAVRFAIRPNGSPVPPKLRKSKKVSTRKSQDAPKRAPEHSSMDSVDLAFEALSEEAQHILRDEAREIARDQNPNAGEAVLTGQTWKQIRRLVRERYI